MTATDARPMTPLRYIMNTYPGPIAIPILDKTATVAHECDWAACERPDFTIQPGESFLMWKGITFCSDCWTRKP